MFKYKKLGKFTYNVIQKPKDIKAFLLKWIGREWKIDHKEHPDQEWTKEWMHLLPKMKFRLAILDLVKIKPRKELMEYKTKNYNFIKELKLRAKEREESMLRGVSSEPLLVNKNDYELMDGYTRYMVLKKYKEKRVYVYLGIVKN
jgi:hypothetical protein